MVKMMIYSEMVQVVKVVLEDLLESMSTTLNHRHYSSRQI